MNASCAFLYFDQPLLTQNNEVMAWRRKWFWKSKAKKKKGVDEEDDDPIPIKKRDKNTVSFQIVASDKFGTNTKCKTAIALLKKIPGCKLGNY